MGYTPLFLFLGSVVLFDALRHRIPNLLLLAGLLFFLFMEFDSYGFSGIKESLKGMLVGLAVFLPMYAMSGMAAGDVKMMAVIGVPLGVSGVLWASAYSLIFGAVIGIGYMLFRGDLGRFFVRYWAMASLRAFIPAQDGDSARHRFPYAVAIAAGTIASLYWKPV